MAKDWKKKAGAAVLLAVVAGGIGAAVGYHKGADKPADVVEKEVAADYLSVGGEAFSADEINSLLSDLEKAGLDKKELADAKAALEADKEIAEEAKAQLEAKLAEEAAKLAEAEEAAEELKSALEEEMGDPVAKLFKKAVADLKADKDEYDSCDGDHYSDNDIDVDVDDDYMKLDVDDLEKGEYTVELKADLEYDDGDEECELDDVLLEVSYDDDGDVDVDLA